jgi:hypothetical protein
MSPTATQQRIPGTESEIDELDDLASEYANIRDQRMELNRQEAALKQNLLTMMHRHKKTTYHHDGIEIDIIQEEETVKVRVKKPKDEEGDED